MTLLHIPPLLTESIDATNNFSVPTLLSKLMIYYVKAAYLTALLPLWYQSYSLQGQNYFYLFCKSMFSQQSKYSQEKKVHCILVSFANVTELSLSFVHHYSTQVIHN